LIDLHCHLLPGIDDGPATEEESLRLCRIAAADGITHAICTPHIHPGRWDNTRESIAGHCRKLQQALDAHNIPLQLGYAGEVRLTDQVMQQVQTRQIPFYGTVEGYQVMLLEFPHGHIIPGSDKLVAWLLNHNIRPLIAHPERNKQVMKDPQQLQAFIEAGCWLQLTAGSVLGNFGERAQAIAHQLLEEDAVTVLASDGHNAGPRQPALKQVFAAIAGRYGKDKASQLLLHTPNTIAGAQFEAQAAAV
jgi:protein-tyrosine phosphatase